MIKGWQAFCNKAIQTREIKNNPMSVGQLISLTTKPPEEIKGLSLPSKDITALYYFVGTSEDISYFILADLIDERSLMKWKDKIENKNIINFDNYKLLSY